jgi:hypothetical protein
VSISDEQFAELERRLGALEDRKEILDCITRYGRGLDRLDANLIRSAFHSDGIDDHGAFVGTVDEFVPWAIECESAFKLTHHGISSHSCEVDGHLAHCESYVHFFVAFEEKPTIGAGAGRYIDKLEKRDGRWAITIRRFVLDWTFDVSSSQWLGPEWSASSPLRNKDDLAYQRPLQAPAR